MNATDARLEVLVGPLPASDASAHGASYYWYEPFDVLLHWRPHQGGSGGTGCFVMLERSLRDFAAFASDLRATLPGLATLFRWEQFVEESIEDVQLLVTPSARRQRLRFALETFLAEQLVRSSTPRAAQSLVVQRFVVPDVLRLSHNDPEWQHRGQQYREAVDEAFAAAASSSDSPLPLLGTATASASSAWDPSAPPTSAKVPLLLLRDEWIPAGCSFEHEVMIPVGSRDGEASAGGALVVWKFVSQRAQLTFAVHFSPTEDSSASGDQDQDVDSNPYSAAGFDAAYSMKTEEASPSAPASSWEVVRYKSTVNFPEDLTDDSTLFSYGHWAVTRPGVLRFTWENADMNCVLSKQLQFQIAMVSQSELGVDGSASSAHVERLNDFEKIYATREEGMSVVDLLALAAKSVDDELPDWCQKDEEQSISDDGERDSLGAFDDGDAFGNVTATQQQRLDLIEDVHQAQRISQLEAKVAELERSLMSTKQELREARNQTEIANEIYKASLETITRLEHEAVVGRRTDSQPEVNVQATARGAETSVPIENGVDESEHERIKSLCASFQEQCLWRSIETAESEKRNLQLEAKLNEALNEKQAMAEQLEAIKRELLAMEEQSRKLKAHRAVLAQEVKRLQPFSQVNLTALVQEAQEARMMQRSIQAQLDRLRGDGGGGEATSRDAEAIGAYGGSSDDDADAAATDFVVVSSQHSDE